MRKIPAERTGTPCRSDREGLRVAEWRSWECEGANEENTSDAMRTQCCGRRLARQHAVCLAAGVSPRGWDEGYEEASDRTAWAWASYAVCRNAWRAG
jgi:hypothetical protein